MSVAAATCAGETSHVHVGDHGLKALMSRGMADSETFRSIVAQLDAAPIQVFAACDSFMPDGLSGRLNFVSSVRGVRYVRVAIRCWLSPRRQLAFLAHELQHALEIANNPDIDEADSMEHLTPTTASRLTDGVGRARDRRRPGDSAPRGSRAQRK
jgi:hypothetical protein